MGPFKWLTASFKALQTCRTRTKGCLDWAGLVFPRVPISIKFPSDERRRLITAYPDNPKEHELKVSAVPIIGGMNSQPSMSA